MDKIKLLRIILFLLIVVWAVVVFSFSNQQGEESSGLSRVITALFVHDEELINIVEPYVRKFAHFSEYAVGGGLFMALFSTYNWSDRKKIMLSVCIGIWYAITDEFHQMFVSDRCASIKDVYIDSLGVAVGSLFILLFIKLFYKYRKIKLLDKKGTY